MGTQVLWPILSEIISRCGGSAFANVPDNNLRLSTGHHFLYHGPTFVHAQNSTIHKVATSASEAELYQLKKTKLADSQSPLSTVNFKSVVVSLCNEQTVL